MHKALVTFLQLFVHLMYVAGALDEGMLDDRVKGTGADLLKVECMTRCMMPLRERQMGDITCVSAGN
jgi:hypothetical protein